MLKPAALRLYGKPPAKIKVCGGLFSVLRHLFDVCTGKHQVKK